MLPVLAERYQVALLTNGLSDFQREKIRAVDLERWIPTVYVSSELDFWKPSPEIFRHVLADLGARAVEAAMVGDSLRHDIAGAAAAGLRTVWMRRHGQAPRDDVKPDATMEDLRPLSEVLRGWGCLSGD
jgi:putative hydrolase of the HAD superfamily